MSRPERSILSLDYKELHSRGRRVFKKREKTKTGEVEMDSLTSDAIKICSDVEDFFESYDLDEITEEEGLLGYVGEIKLLKQEYRRVHALLKNADAGGFATNCPYYDRDMQNLTDKFKEANKKMQAVREAAQKVDASNPVVNREKAQVISKRKYFLEQVNADIASNDLEELTSI